MSLSLEKEVIAPPKTEDEPAILVPVAIPANDEEEEETDPAEEHDPNEDEHEDETEGEIAPTEEEDEEEAEANESEYVDDGTVPDWYFDGVDDEMNETTAPAAPPPAPKKKIRKPRARTPLRSGPKGVVHKPVVVKLNPNPACIEEDLPELLLKMQHCAPEMASVEVKFGSGECQPVAGIWEPDEDPNEKWICRPEVSKGRWRPRPSSSGTMLEIFNQKCTEAMELLMEKLERGEIRNSWERECNPKFLFGVDVTPTPSTCGVNSSHLSFATTFTDMDKDRIHQKTTEVLVEEINKYLYDAEMAAQGGYKIGEWAYCPNMNLLIDEYLHEPTAEYMLKSVGVLDEAGNILCNFSDFYQVEHAVKSLMVELAKKCIDEYMLSIKAPTPEETTSELAFNEGFQGRMDKREKLAQVLMEDLQECCPDFYNKKKEEQAPRRLTRPTKMYQGALPPPSPVDDDIAKRGLDSLTQEKYAEEIAGKILTGIYRPSLFQEGDDDIIEIMPFQDRESFITDSGKPVVGQQPGRKTLPQREGGIMLEEPIKAEFKSWDLDHKSNLCYTSLDYINPRNFHEWENYKKLDDFNHLIQDKVPFSRKDRKLYLQLKYFIQWLQAVRKCNAIRSYSTHEGKPEHYFPRWKGPYPAHVLANIRALKGMSGFDPKSSKSFYKGVRKLEATMFEKSRLILKNIDKEEEEEPVPSKFGRRSRDEESGSDNENEFDEFEEEGEGRISETSEDDDKAIFKIFESKMSAVSVSDSRDRMESIFDRVQDENEYLGENYEEDDDLEDDEEEDDDEEDYVEDEIEHDDETEIDYEIDFDEPPARPDPDPRNTPSNETLHKVPSTIASDDKEDN